MLRLGLASYDAMLLKGSALVGHHMMPWAAKALPWFGII